MAPRGRSRRDLALALAGPQGQVQTFLHPQSEPSLVPNMAVFDSLTQGFRCIDATGQHVASCVDDLTLQDGLDKRTPPRRGWYRIVSDDRRLLHLVRRMADPEVRLEDALLPTAKLFGTELQHAAGGLIKVVDELGSPVCIGAQLPGERERPCEIVSPPIAPEADFDATLEHLLATARSLAFTVPAESATHLHLESAALENAGAVANLVLVLQTYGDALKHTLRTNPRCVRLGPIPAALLDAVQAPDFRDLPWPEARERLKETKPSKYVDWNLKNLVHPRPDKPTFEVRVLPGSLVGSPIQAAARLFVAIAQLAAAPHELTAQAPTEDLRPLLDRLVAEFDLDPAVAKRFSRA